MENSRFETFCHRQFIDLFFEQLMAYQSEYDFADPTTENLSYNQLRDLIFLKSDLLLDEGELEVLALKNPYYKALIKNSLAGGSRIHDFSKQFKNHIEKNSLINCSPSALHYLKPIQQNKIDSLYNSNGVFINGSDCWKKKIHDLSESKTYNIHFNKHLNDFPGWKLLKDKNLPINSFVIVDQFLLKESSLFEKNLFQIIKNILPNELEDLSFHLSIITSQDGNSDKIFMERQLKKIQNQIEILNKPYPIAFTIWVSSSKYAHNRWMLSNYFHLKSEQSFSYYNKEGKITKEAELSYFGINGRPYKLHYNKLQSLKEGIKNADVFGAGINRLLK